MQEITFTEEDFEKLVEGKVVEKTGSDGTVLKLALKDVTFDYMFRTVHKKFREFIIKQDRKKE